MKTREEEISRAKQAEQLLRNELLTEAFDELERLYSETWRSTTPSQTEAREKVYFLLQALSHVRTHIEQVVMTGEMAELSRQQLHLN